MTLWGENAPTSWYYEFTELQNDPNTKPLCPAVLICKLRKKEKRCGKVCTAKSWQSQTKIKENKKEKKPVSRSSTANLLVLPLQQDDGSRAEQTAAPKEPFWDKKMLPGEEQAGAHGQRQQRVLAAGYQNALSGCPSPSLLKVWAMNQQHQQHLEAC